MKLRLGGEEFALSKSTVEFRTVLSKNIFFLKWSAKERKEKKRNHKEIQDMQLVSDSEYFTLRLSVP